MKTDFEANVCYAKIVSRQKFLGFFNSALDQILVRSFIEGLSKQSQKVIPGETSLLRNLIEIKRMVITVIDKLASATQALESLKIWNS